MQENKSGCFFLNTVYNQLSCVRLGLMVLTAVNVMLLAIHYHTISLGTKVVILRTAVPDS